MFKIPFTKQYFKTKVSNWQSHFLWIIGVQISLLCVWPWCITYICLLFNIRVHVCFSKHYVIVLYVVAIFYLYGERGSTAHVYITAAGMIVLYFTEHYKFIFYLMRTLPTCRLVKFRCSWYAGQKNGHLWIWKFSMPLMYCVINDREYNGRSLSLTEID